MNELKYIEIFDNFFNTEPFYKDGENHKLIKTANNSFNITTFFAIGQFQETNVNIISKPYNYVFNISFKNLLKSELKNFFDTKNYNYDLLDKTINELFKIGKSYNFYQNMTPIKNNRLEDCFIQNGYPNPRVNNTKNLTKIALSGFLTDKYTNENPLKKVAQQHLDFYVADTGEIYPIMTLFFPYSSSADFLCFINLHPSQRESQIKHLKKIKKEFTEHLIEQLDTVLKRKLKFKKEELLQMTIQEKLNYIPVIEMSRI